MPTSISATSYFLSQQADELVEIGSALTRATADIEWSCAKADRFREAMRGRILLATGASMALRNLADRVDGRHAF